MRVYVVSALAAVSMLGACAKPTTISPDATRAEVAAEQRAQEDFFHQKNTQTDGPPPVYNDGDVIARLEAVNKRVAPAAVELCKELKLYPNPMSCAYDIHKISGRSKSGKETLNAYAGGKVVKITPAMVRFTKDNNELAYIIAHEFAHNMMRHVASKKQNVAAGLLIGVLADAVAASQGVQMGGNSFSNIGAQAGVMAYSPAFEQEADYIALYMLARAGYDYEDVPQLWRRMSLNDKKSIYFGATHPSNAERFVIMKKAIDEINLKKTSGMPLYPEFNQSQQ